MQNAQKLQPELFPNMMIASFTTAITYPRRDLRSRMETVIDTVHGPVQAAVRNAGYSGSVKVDVDDDGDLRFSFESGAFHFQLDIASEISGAQFQRLSDHTAALAVTRALLDNVIRALEPRSLDALAVDFSNIFYLATETPGTRNINIFIHRLMPALRTDDGALGGLITRPQDIRRIDFKVGWQFDESCTAYLKLELPANEEHSTFWSSLNLRSREDAPPPPKGSTLIELFDKSYQVYIGKYAQLMSHLLADERLNFVKESALVAE